MRKVVYLSPSTQERNIGVGAYGTEEKRMNQIADQVEKILIYNGIVVYRNNPQWSILQVVKNSNNIEPDIHVAIHSNAGGGRGCEVFAYQSKSQGEVLAKSIYKEVESLTPSKDRGVKFNSKLYELRGTKSIAVLIEMAFHDDEKDAVWIINNIHCIARAIAKGIINYFGLKFTEFLHEEHKDLEGIVKNCDKDKDNYKDKRDALELLKEVEFNVKKLEEILSEY